MMTSYDTQEVETLTHDLQDNLFLQIEQILPDKHVTFVSTPPNCCDRNSELQDSPQQERLDFTAILCTLPRRPFSSMEEMRTQAHGGNALRHPQGISQRPESGRIIGKKLSIPDIILDCLTKGKKMLHVH